MTVISPDLPEMLDGTRCMGRSDVPLLYTKLDNYTYLPFIEKLGILTTMES